MNISKEQEKALEKQEYFDVLLYILDESDYASKIAKDMGKTQPTITEQLQKMEALSLVEALKKGKSKRYRVNYEILAEYVYSLVAEYRDYRKTHDDIDRFDPEKLKKLDEVAIRKALPIELIADFFNYYAIGIVDLVGGKVKPIDEVVVSFFGAIESLNDEDYFRLKEEYKVRKRSFDIIVDYMAFESIEKEKVAIITMLDVREDERKESK